LYSNIPEEDWQKEFIKVSNMLEIAEVSDEYMVSFSESSSNNKDSNKLEGNYPTVKYIKNVNKLLDDKLLEDAEIIENYSNNIEKELDYISKKENKISVNNSGLKEELNKLKITKQANVHYQEEYDLINKDIKKMEKEKDKIEYELDKIKKEEKKILNLDNKNNQEEYDSINKKIKMKEKEKIDVEYKLENIRKKEKKAVGRDDKSYIQKMRKAIENIYEDNNKIEEEISLLNTVIINKYSNIMYNIFMNNDNENNNFMFNGKINNINDVVENINDNQDVFGDDEII
jgi:hypothetical protein